MAAFHRSFLSVDTHADTPFEYLLDSLYDFSVRHDFSRGKGRVDLPRMKEGSLDAVFMAAFVWQGPLTDSGRGAAALEAAKVIAAVHKKVQKDSALAGIALTPDDAYDLKRQGKRAIFIGIENGYAIGTNIGRIREFYGLGVRYITLCHVKNNDICTSSTDSTGGQGLTEFGKQVIGEMNRTGMMIDVSHISDEAFFDIMKITSKPVIASHTCARSLCDTSRNISDRQLEAIRKNGGVVQICFVSEYLKRIPPNHERENAMKALRKKYGKFSELNSGMQEMYMSEKAGINEKYPLQLASVSDVVDHIDHIVKTIGVDYVGIGTDFDGGGELSDCRDVSQMKNITLELARRGYSKKDIAKIWGENIMRVMREAQNTGQSD